MPNALQTAYRETVDPSPLEFCSLLQRQHENSTPINERKEKGQIFTPPSVCRFMAELLSPLPDDLTLLDAGAGVGSLTAAVCEIALSLPSLKTINAHLYESDPELLSPLKLSMEHCKEALLASGKKFSFSIHSEDFILDGPTHSCGDLFKPSLSFDAAILNPPYFKVGVDSPHARAMADLIKIHTNIYALFLAKASQLLRKDGKLVAITPRSFCNGLYFKEFRQWFFSRQNLEHVHLFECRKSTFDDVLQESVITLSRRSAKKTSSVRITTSHNRDIPACPPILQVPKKLIIDEEQNDWLLNIPTSEVEAELLAMVNKWTFRFSEIGLKVSTGPVVTFRVKEFLLENLTEKNYVPLIAPHNVKLFNIEWPIKRTTKPIAFLSSPESKKHLVPTQNYVLLRRFTAKEEKRRLVASCFFASSLKAPLLAIENHVNYIYHSTRKLSDVETVGIASLLNSNLFDTYFRILSGNTQVNATELRMMKFPSLDTLAAIGEKVTKLDGYPSTEIENLLLTELKVTGLLKRHFTERTIEQS